MTGSEELWDEEQDYREETAGLEEEDPAEVLEQAPPQVLPEEEGEVWVELKELFPELSQDVERVHHRISKCDNILRFLHNLHSHYTRSRNLSGQRVIEQVIRTLERLRGQLARLEALLIMAAVLRMVPEDLADVSSLLSRWVRGGILTQFETTLRELGTDMGRLALDTDGLDRLLRRLERLTDIQGDLLDTEEGGEV